MNGIYGILQILKGKDEKEAKFIAAARRSRKALTNIVNDILDLQKIIAGKLEIVPEWQSSIELFKELYLVHCSVAELKGLTLTMDYKGLPNMLWCDDLRMLQILNNIIGNAIKFTDQGSIRVNISHINEHLFITISDTGIGMDSRGLAQLFQRSTQADSSYRKRFAGTGLGMAITKDLIEMMGGSIKVDSTLGQGTTFYLKIPIAAKDLPSANTSSPSRIIVDHSLRVLLVEDNPISLDFAEEMLREYLTFVETATDGVEALDILSQHEVDIVITDIQMPRMSGEELQRQLAISHTTLPVIALTANAFESDREAYHAAGFKGVLTKPFTQRDLFDLINTRR